MTIVGKNNQLSAPSLFLGNRYNHNVQFKGIIYISDQETLLSRSTSVYARWKVEIIVIINTNICHLI